MRISFYTEILKKLRSLLTRKQKFSLIFLVMLSIFLSLIEAIGISVIMPFAAIASNPEMLDTGKYKAVYDFLGFTQKNAFIVVFGISIIFFYLFRGVYSTAYTYVQRKFSYNTSRFLALNLFKVYFSIPYKQFVQKNSGELRQLILGETARISNLVINVLQILSESFIVLLLYGFMLIVNWRMTLVLSMILLIGVLFVLAILPKVAKQQGIKTTNASIKRSRMIQEAFGNFKFIKLRGNENDFLISCDESTKTLAHAQTISAIIEALPRNILENLGFSLLIGTMIFIVWKLDSPESIVAIVATYAMALYRMLPAINKILVAVSALAYDQISLNIVFDAMNQELESEGVAPLSFDKTIKINDLSFRYITGDDVLKKVSFELNKGESVAITGESGGGKSTLVDILIGINKPDSGGLYVDDVKIVNENIRSWRRKIGYIPQNIYLFDGTISENVTFSSEFNKEHLIKTLKMANIWDFLEKKDGINTVVGEGGIQLSGGQKQRVGIARALYSNPEILVLDEATSALDNDTESKIMEEIYTAGRDKTLIIIAHRLSTVERCKKRIIINNGRIVYA